MDLCTAAVSGVCLCAHRSNESAEQINEKYIKRGRRKEMRGRGKRRLARKVARIARKRQLRTCWRSRKKSRKHIAGDNTEGRPFAIHRSQLPGVLWYGGWSYTWRGDSSETLDAQESDVSTRFVDKRLMAMRFEMAGRRGAWRRTPTDVADR